VKPTVVLTRPGNDNRELAGQLQAEGFTVLIQPVMRITPCDPGPLPTLTSDSKVIFISANAVEHGLRTLDLALEQSQASCFAVGQRTASALAAAGFSAVCPERADSEGLLALPALADVAGESVLLVKGEGGRQLLAETLSTRGAQVMEYCCYRRDQEPVDAQAFCQRLSSTETVIFQANSVETLDYLEAILSAGRCLARDRAVVAVPSVRVASVARERGWQQVVELSDARDNTFFAFLNAYR